MNPRILALAAAALVAGCSSGKPAPRARAASTAPKQAEKAAVQTEATPPAEPEGDFVYSGAGKRDPFRSYLAEFTKETNTFASRCVGPLGKYEIEQLRLVAVITGLEDPVAMVEVPGGEGVVVRRNQCIGKNGGVVAAVRTGEVVVTEYRVRADGTRDAIQTALQLPKQQASYVEE
ncbi:MAG TPA: pilus assembly protein PilP [Anaeromyxobacter sp.]|nr:pilus assembly protein PilP [Anaeromyxobacter sp.]